MSNTIIGLIAADLLLGISVGLSLSFLSVLILPELIGISFLVSFVLLFSALLISIPIFPDFDSPPFVKLWYLNDLTDTVIRNVNDTLLVDLSAYQDTIQSNLEQLLLPLNYNNTWDFAFSAHYNSLGSHADLSSIDRLLTKLVSIHYAEHQDLYDSNQHILNELNSTEADLKPLTQFELVTQDVLQQIHQYDGIIAKYETRCQGITDRIDTLTQPEVASETTVKPLT